MLTSIRRKLLWIVVLAVGGGLARPAFGYIDYSPTLGQLIKDSTHIVVIRVDKVSQEKRAILFQKVADLKGKFDTEKINYQITDGKTVYLFGGHPTPLFPAACVFASFPYKVARGNPGPVWLAAARSSGSLS